jgi:hypothetical protein
MISDEQWYMQASKTMRMTGSLEGLRFNRSIGWPFLISLGFFFFGVDNTVALNMATILGSLTVANIFLLSHILFNNKWISIGSALLFSLFASHIRWSATAESNIAGLFFATITLFFSVLY